MHMKGGKILILTEMHNFCNVIDYWLKYLLSAYIYVSLHTQYFWIKQN